MQNLVELLKSKGLKSTFQRLQILEVIGMCGHKDIDEIYDAVIKTYPTISLATVYKNIIIMSDAGVLCEVSIIGKKSKYEIAKDDHLHLICSHCGSVDDFHTDASFDKLVTKEHFSLQKTEINLYGICNKCQNIKVS